MEKIKLERIFLSFKGRILVKIDKIANKKSIESTSLFVK